ncbi:MAG TPA: T9SS type A sorting domain-containing protein [Cytophagaceae bacterium]|nr:T9SS type A sorting domain-containing protein [Cytophagaceae bacterium]
MIKNYGLYFFLLILSIASFCRTAEAQLIHTGLVDDPFRATNNSTNGSNLRIAATQAYTDTLRLPFFEDFTDIVVSIDSIVIDNTTDSIVRIYDSALNAYADSTLIAVGFTKPQGNSTTAKLASTLWYIKKIGTNEFILDSSNNNVNNVLKINVDTIIKNGFWRLSERFYYSAYLDLLKWMDGGGTYINNRFPSEPVSPNVATFDGLNANGDPYNTINVFAKGYTDNLTSLPIDLTPYTPIDSIYLSFFWQESSVGDAPETEDFIQLEFKDSTGVWSVMQKINGNIPYMNAFNISMNAVIDPVYFHKDFQFRFRSWGRESGPFDVWNIDNIYLNSGRSYKDTLFDDKSIGNLPATFLKNYNAMPYNQYFANAATESGDMNFTDNNLGRDRLSQEFFYVVADYIVHPDSILFSRDTSAFHQPDSINVPHNSQRTFFDVCTPDVSSLSSFGHPIYIEQTFRISLSDTLNILFANNNKFSTRTIFWDYYAYDDGSPESSVGSDQQGLKTANKFTINLSDTLTDIDIYFTKSKGPNMAGRSILISVWDQNRTLVYQSAAQVAYGGFVRYHLNSPIVIPAGQDYYVGFQQNFNDLLTIGYDNNYDHSDKVYFNSGGSDWNAFNMQPGYSQGSMMIRPVFDKHETLFLSATPAEEPLNALLYPVPVQDVLKIEGKITSLTVYDLTGRKIAGKTYEILQEDKQIDLTNIVNGLYIVELKQNDRTMIQKIIVQHGF